MTRRIQIRRLVVLMGLLVAVFVVLGARLVDLQIFRHEELSVKARTNTQKAEVLEPRRGDILDCKGTVLATSVMVKNVCGDPSLIGARTNDVARAIGPLLEMNEAVLARMLAPRLTTNSRGESVPVRFVLLKKKVPVETWEKIQDTMKNLSFSLEGRKLSKKEEQYYSALRKKGLFARDDQRRDYPNHTLAAHVLGFAATEEGEVNGIPVSEIRGQDGIEYKFNDQLTGVRGWRVTEIDSFHREQVAFREQDVAPRDGFNVVLTIDSVIQNMLERALAEASQKYTPISICGLVVRPKTGEILAMATLPTYDPGTPSKYALDARRNRIIADTSEPGSTFKIVVASGALNDGAVRLTDVFNCEHGRFFFAGRILHDHETYDDETVETIIMKSSNIGAAKIGIKLGERRVYGYVQSFGFGALTGVPLPGEVSAKRYVPPVEEWSKVTIAQIPMGHGLSVTRMQMTMAMCAIANNGWLMRPMLVDRLEDRDHNLVAKYTPQRVRQVISEDTSKLMVKALKTVVSPKGTAAKAALTHYVAAGKTGTAQKVEKGFYVSKYFSSFIGFFPADDPELCIAISLDEPKNAHYGGQTAAPVFKVVAEQAASYLNIRPDDENNLPGLELPPAQPEGRGLSNARSTASLGR